MRIQASGARLRQRASVLALTTTVLMTGLVALAQPAEANGQFHIDCGVAKHNKRIDPIVDPGRRSMHRHDLYGGESISRNSTYRSMRRGGTACDSKADKSGYWHPTLIKHGRVIRPMRISAYYWGGPTSNRVRAFPKNLRIIAGGNTNRQLQAGYNCGEGMPTSKTPLDCHGEHLKGVVVFPSCWNGKSLGIRGNHRSHMAYPEGGECKGKFPVTLPKLIIHIRWPITDGRGAHLVSDRHMGMRHGMSLHADFWNVWRQSALQKHVDQCINQDRTCSIG